MATLVLRSWKVDTKPIDANGNYVDISGRQSGLLSWFLALLGVDPTTTIKIGPVRVEFHQSSLSGISTRMIPLQGICSTYYGYYKPWKEALAIIVLCSVLGNVIMAAGSWTGALLVWLLGLVLGFLYYFLNKTLTLGFVENSGVANGIQFKRSVIENVAVDADQARVVCEITQSLIEQKIQ